MRELFARGPLGNAKCAQGDAEAGRGLPGIHISGNVQIHGNVTMFGDGYRYGPPPAGR